MRGASAHISALISALRFEPYLPQRNTDDYVETFSMGNFLANKVGTPPVSTLGSHPTPGADFPGRLGIPAEPTVQQPRQSRASPRGRGLGFGWRRQNFGARLLWLAIQHAAHVLLYPRARTNPPWGATLPAPADRFRSLNPVAGISRRRSVPPEYRNGANSSVLPHQRRYAFSDPNLKNPQVNTWNLTIQRQLGKWLLSGSILGITPLTCGPARS